MDAAADHPRVLDVFSCQRYPRGMSPPISRRRFPAPWRAVQTAGGYRVEDAAGMPLAYICGSANRMGVGDNSLTLDEARRIAAGIAKLPALLEAKDRAGRS